MSNSKFDSIIFSAELNDTEISVLDVHGYTQDEALYTIEEFLCKEHARGKRRDHLVLKIITGNGGGKLQNALKNLLSKKSFDFIEYFRHQEQPWPSSSVTFVVLAPNY